MASWAMHEYGKLYEDWPRDERGEPEEPAFLTNCSPLDMAAEMTQNMLEAYGVPSIPVYPGDGVFGKIMIGMSGSGVDIFVPKSRLADAQELLKGEAGNDGLQEGI